MSFLRAYIYSHIYNLLTFFKWDLLVLYVSLHWMTDMFHALPTTFSDRLTKFRLPPSPLTTNSSPDTKSWYNWRYLPDHRDYDAKASVIWMSEYYWRMLRSFGNVVSNGGTPLFMAISDVCRIRVLGMSCINPCWLFFSVKW